VSVGRITGGVLALLGAAVALEATTFDVSFMTDPVGPKALPFLVAVMLIVAGLRALTRPREELSFPGRGTLLRVAGAVAAFLLYAVALPWVGFFLSTTLVVTALSLLYQGPPARSVFSAAVLSGALWLLFVRALSLPLPVGDLWIR
jgi:putative tricarboxylic transport membrane protein